MKLSVYFLLMSLLVLGACVKDTAPVQIKKLSETQFPSGSYLSAVKDHLKSTIDKSVYNSLDFSQSLVSQEDTAWYLRIGFQNRLMQNKFLLISTDVLGNINTSRIIELQRDPANLEIFNGRILVSNLDGQLLSDNTIVNGFVRNDRIRQPGNTAENAMANMFLVPAAPVEELPEVIVIGYTDGGGGLSFGDYIYLSGLIGSGSGGSAGVGSGGSSGGSSGGNYSGGVSSPVTIIRPAAGSGIYTPVTRSTTSRPVSVTIENSYSKPGISVPSFLKCFSNVPDAGASYAITILVDLPVNNNPTQFFDPYTGATGHTFLQLTKTSGSQSVTQFMGFTAANALSAITSSGPVSGKVVDNADHKFNASLRVPVNAAEFTSALNKMQSQASAKYDIVNYNCVDFALGVINSARGNYPLIINKYPLPNEPTPMSTPEALYNLIQSMARPGGPEAGNTSIGSVWSAGVSHGACN
jgi:hypothetical protein